MRIWPAISAVRPLHRGDLAGPLPHLPLHPHPPISRGRCRRRSVAGPDRQQTFTYDTCPADATGCVSAPGQLAQATFASMAGLNDLNFEYNYAYTPAGKVSSKTLEVQSANHVSMGDVKAWGA